MSEPAHSLTHAHSRLTVFGTLGSTSVTTFSSSFSHQYGKLGNFNGQPTTVGSIYTDGHRKVETLGPGGWASLDDFPEYVFTILCWLRISRNYRGHDLMGLSNGEMVLIGGYNNDDGTISDAVWKLGFAGWTQIGTLQQVLF